MGPRGLVDIPPLQFDAVDAAIADACLGVEKAVGRGKVGYVNVAVDISPACDCAGFADVPIIPHLGVFASKDAVAIDMACVDKAREAEGIRGSKAELMEAHHSGDKKFEHASATFHTQSEVTSINAGHENGLGSRDYELIECEPGDVERFRFPYDTRPSRQRFAEKFEKFQPFPYDRHDGKGFDRLDEIDLDKVRHHYEDDGEVSVTEVKESIHADGDD
jgi:hypothetical protein